MRKSDIYEVAIKILGLYLVFILLEQLRDILISISILIESKKKSQLYTDFDQTNGIVIAVLSFFVLLLFSLFIIFKTKSITKFICKPTDYEESVTLFAKKNTVYEIAIIIVGLITIINTLPEIAYYLKIKYNERTQDNFRYATLIALLLKLLLGIIAINFSKKLSEFFSRNKN